MAAALALHDRCLLLDIHSFPSVPLPYEFDQSSDRPDICLGTDSFHSPDSLVELSRRAFEAEGFRVAINQPFSGVLVPARYYRSDPRVHGLMVEINRRLYMDEETGAKGVNFDALCAGVQRAIAKIHQESR